MRIGFVADDFLLDGDILRPGGCSYYRCLLPRNTLRGLKSAFGPPAFTMEHGFGVRVSKTHAEFGFDVIVLKMIMDRWTLQYMDTARALGQRFIVDVDDFYPGLHEQNRAYTVTDPEFNRLRNRDYYRQIIEKADLVTVSTPFLRDYYQDVNEVVMVRNGINPNQFTRRPVKGGKPVLGWAGAMGWRSNDAETARPWLNDFLTEHDLLFHHAGHMPDAPAFADAAGVAPQRVITSPMRPLYRYAEMLDFDIGVVLLSDIPFNHAKSNIKGLEYAASGIPFVAQALPEYQHLADAGVGRVAVTGDDWRRELTALLDFKTRKREAAIQFNRVRDEQSITARASEWVDVFGRFTDARASIPDRVVRYENAS